MSEKPNISAACYPEYIVPVEEYIAQLEADVKNTNKAYDASLFREKKLEAENRRLREALTKNNAQFGQVGRDDLIG